MAPQKKKKKKKKKNPKPPVLSFLEGSPPPDLLGAAPPGATPNAALVLVNFELKLPSGPNTPYVMVMGGADADRDGTVEDNGEYAAFTRDGNTWTHSQPVAGPTRGMIFYVQFTVGPNVPYEFVIKDGGGAVLYPQSGNVTVGDTGRIRWTLL